MLVILGAMILLIKQITQESHKTEIWSKINWDLMYEWLLELRI